MPKLDTPTTKEKATDLLRCFQRAFIYENNNSTHVTRFVTENQKNKQVTFKNVISIGADKNAHTLIKGKLKLAQAIVDISFAIERQGSIQEGPVTFSCIFDSDIINRIKDEASKTMLSQFIAAWYKHKAEGWPATLDIDTCAFINFNTRENWKVYTPIDPSGTSKDLYYVHFPEYDSWLAFRFIDLASTSKVIQIISKSESFIIAAELLHPYIIPGSYLVSSDHSMFLQYMYAYDIAPALVSKSFFNCAALTDTADNLIDNFKEDQDDPYIDSDALEAEPLKFLNGSEEELGSLVTLICHAAIPIHYWDNLHDFSIVIESGIVDEDSATVAYDNMDYTGWDKVRELLPHKITYLEQAFDAALDQNQPYGYSWEYNDGAYDRQSGYDRNACRLSFPIRRPSAHEQICAKIEIKKLVSIFGKATVEGLLA